MISGHDIWAAALLMVKRYGADAMLEASARADQLTEDGDAAGATTWHRILDAIERLQAPTPAKGEGDALMKPAVNANPGTCQHAQRQGFAHEARPNLELVVERPPVDRHSRRHRRRRRPARLPAATDFLTARLARLAVLAVLAALASQSRTMGRFCPALTGGAFFEPAPS